MKRWVGARRREESARRRACVRFETAPGLAAAVEPALALNPLHRTAGLYHLYLPRIRHWKLYPRHLKVSAM